MNLNKFIQKFGAFMVRAFKASKPSLSLENLRVHLIPSDRTENYSPEQEKEVIELVSKFVQLGRARRRKNSNKEDKDAA